MSTGSPTTSAPSRPPRSSGSDGVAAAPVAGPAACANCGATLGGPYCARCGQRAGPPDPSLRELAEEAWDAFVSVDGKLVNTVRLLVLRPGEMTARYVAGHRAPFIPPLRLYLACSVAFFLLQSSLPKGERVIKVNASDGRERKTPEQIEREVAAMRGPAWRKRLKLGAMRSAYTQEASFGEQLIARAPQAMFGLVPLQAALLALVYRRRRRRFPLHLVFALHAHAAMFALLAATGALAVVAPRAVRAPLAGAGLAAIAVYLPLAMRRVYGGRWAPTLARAVVIGAVYSVALGAAVIALVLATMWAVGGP